MKPFKCYNRFEYRLEQTIRRSNSMVKILAFLIIFYGKIKQSNKKSRIYSKSFYSVKLKKKNILFTKFIWKSCCVPKAFSIFRHETHEKAFLYNTYEVENITIIRRFTVDIHCHTIDIDHLLLCIERVLTALADDQCRVQNVRYSRQCFQVVNDAHFVVSNVMLSNEIWSNVMLLGMLL